jgi:hypothetical protein
MTLHAAGDKHRLHNTLACLLDASLGHIVTLELRDESHITGRIITVTERNSGYLGACMSPYLVSEEREANVLSFSRSMVS